MDDSLLRKSLSKHRWIDRNRRRLLMHSLNVIITILHTSIQDVCRRTIFNRFFPHKHISSFSQDQMTPTWITDFKRLFLYLYSIRVKYLLRFKSSAISLTKDVYSYWQFHFCIILHALVWDQKCDVVKKRNELWQLIPPNSEILYSSFFFSF